MCTHTETHTHKETHSTDTQRETYSMHAHTHETDTQHRDKPRDTQARMHTHTRDMHRDIQARMHRDTQTHNTETQRHTSIQHTHTTQRHRHTTMQAHTHTDTQHRNTHTHTDSHKHTRRPHEELNNLRECAGSPRDLSTERHPFPGRGSHPSTRRPPPGAWYSCRFQTGLRLRGLTARPQAQGHQLPQPQLSGQTHPGTARGANPSGTKTSVTRGGPPGSTHVATHSSGQIENASVTRLTGHLHTRGQTHRWELLWVRWSGLALAPPSTL